MLIQCEILGERFNLKSPQTRITNEGFNTSTVEKVQIPESAGSKTLFYYLIRFQFLLGDGLVIAEKAISLAVRLGAPIC